MHRSIACAPAASFLSLLLCFSPRCKDGKAETAKPPSKHRFEKNQLVWHVRIQCRRVRARKGASSRSATPPRCPGRPRWSARPTCAIRHRGVDPPHHPPLRTYELNWRFTPTRFVRLSPDGFDYEAPNHPPGRICGVMSLRIRASPTGIDRSSCALFACHTHWMR